MSERREEIAQALTEALMETARPTTRSYQQVGADLAPLVEQAIWAALETAQNEAAKSNYGATAPWKAALAALSGHGKE